MTSPSPVSPPPGSPSPVSPAPPPVLSLYHDPNRIWPHEFHFGPPTDETEDITFYMPGGYHPVRIGDVFSGAKGQYRIMHKLGFGAYATVWLAQTVVTGALVALKIPTAGDHGFAEAEMLEAANAAALDHQCVSEFIDKIPIHGPNGLHCGIVTEVIVTLASAGICFQPRRWRKEVAYGMVQAMAQVHRAGIVHGDFHMANTGVTVPLSTDAQAQEQLMQDLGEYELTVVLPIDPTKQTASLPPYIVTPCRWADHSFNDLAEMKPHIKVYDFGNAYRVGSENPAFRCAVEAYAPEIECVEKKERVPIAFSSDIWALGSAIFETITGTTLFRNISPAMLPERAVQMAGRVPPQWQAWWDSKPREPLSGDPDAWWDSPEQRDWIINGCADEEDVDADEEDDDTGEEDANGAICLLKKLLAQEVACSRSCLRWIPPRDLVARKFCGIRGSRTLRHSEHKGMRRYAWRTRVPLSITSNSFPVARTDSLKRSLHCSDASTRKRARWDYFGRT